MFEIYIYLHYLMFVVKQMLMIDHSNFEPAVVVTVVTKISYSKNTILTTIIFRY